MAGKWYRVLLRCRRHHRCHLNSLLLSGITQELIGFISHDLQPEPLSGQHVIGNAGNELATNGGSETINTIMTTTYNHDLMAASAESTDTMFEWQAPLLIYVSDTSQSSVIAIQPSGEMAQITMINGEAFRVSRQAINHLVRWLVGITGWSIRMYMAMYMLYHKVSKDTSWWCPFIH